MSTQIVKAIMLGDAGVGKTTILSVYCENLFTLDYASTIGVDFRVKDLVVSGERYRLQIWDTAGQERFRSITQSYYRGAQIVFLVVDLTRSETIRSVARWLIDIERIIPDKAGYKLIVVGNKIDGTIADGYIEMTTMLQENSIDYYPVSALKRIGIDELFQNAIKAVPVLPLETLADLRDQQVVLGQLGEKQRCC